MNRLHKKETIVNWRNYALIAELIHRLTKKYYEINKKKIHLLIYLLQEIYKIDCGYQFKFYYTVPYSPDIEIDLSTLESWNIIKLVFKNNEYFILPNQDFENLKAKAKEFIDKANYPINELITEFASLSRTELNLITTLVYIHKKSNPPPEKLINLAKELHPKISKDIITSAIKKLQEKQLFGS